MTTTEPYSSVNVGFRRFDNSMYTDEQEKAGLSYFCIKRKVLSPGINTEPLDITLCPWDLTKTYDIVDNKHALSLTRPFKFQIDGSTYGSLRLVCEVAMTYKEPEEFVKKAILQLPP